VIVRADGSVVADIYGNAGVFTSREEAGRTADARGAGGGAATLSAGCSCIGNRKHIAKMGDKRESPLATWGTR